MLLKTIKGITQKQLSNLVAHYKSVEDIFNADYNTIMSFGIKESAAKNLLNRKYNTDLVDEEFCLAEKNNIQIIGYDDKEFPKSLKMIKDSPLYLYVKGSIDCLKKHCIAMVGSRKSSKQGLDFAETLAYDLTTLGFTIVSGFADGIDIASHLGAIKIGKTAAIMGSGFNNIYPEKHNKYVDDVVNNGCIITEYNFDTMPMHYNFPQRNRIIAALSLGVIVVEAQHNSGSLITTDYAKKYNKHIFAVPQFPTYAGSAANLLIKGGAIPIESYKDVARVYRGKVKKVKEKRNKIGTPILEGLESDICSLIVTDRYDIDELCQKLNMDITELSMTLTNLELSNIISKDDYGKYFILGGKRG